MVSFDRKIPMTREQEKSLDALFKPAIEYVEKHGTPVYSGDNPFQAEILEYPPDFAADEATIRAREAIISTGVFCGAEEIIRAGLLDHTHGVQSALELQRSAHLPLTALTSRPHGPLRQYQPHQQPAAQVVYSATFWQNLGHWLTGLRYRFTRLWYRYAKMRSQFDAALKKLELERDGLQEKLIAANKLSDDQRVLLNHRKEEVHRLQSKAKMLSLESKRQHDLKFVELLNACETEEERKALAKLARDAIGEREVDPKTNQVRLSVVINPPAPRHFIKCSTCSHVIREAAQKPHYGYHERCDSCLRQAKMNLDHAFKIAQKPRYQHPSRLKSF